jgi:hypothetical protein
MVPLGPRHPSSTFRFDHVSAIVDAELGILLSCETREGHAVQRGGAGRSSPPEPTGDVAPELTEFVSLTIDPDTEAAAFIAPPGSVTSAPFEGRPFGWDTAKTAAGLAARL